MTRILCCWELGGGLGHLFRLLPLGLVLKKWGHQVIMATPDADQGERLLQSHGFQLAAPPAWQPPPRAFPLSQNYAQNLLRNGYWHRESLSNNLTAWLALFAKFQPDVVVTEHAPTALLAARMYDLPRAAIGTGFTVPPSVSPMPGLQPWFSLPASYLLGLERDFLDQVNPVLRNLGSPPLETVADIFAGAEKILCTLPEFDHYDQRSGEPYWGPVTYTPTDLQPSWPPGEGPKEA